MEFKPQKEVNYLELKKPYDAMVFIKGSEVIAVDSVGTKIASGTAGTDDVDIINTVLNSFTTAYGGKIVLSGLFIVPDGKTITFPSLAKGVKLCGSTQFRTVLFSTKTAPGNVITLSDYCSVEDISIQPYTGAHVGIYTGLYGEAVSFFTSNNVYCISPKIGLKIIGDSYFNDIRNYRVYQFLDYGLVLDTDGVNTPNANKIHFQQIVGTALGTGTGIYCNGSTNEFSGGQINDVNIGVDLYGNRSWLKQFWIENATTLIKVSEGVHIIDNYSLGDITLAADTHVYSTEGNCVFGLSLPIRSTRINENLNAVYIFDEKSGSIAFDRSGNGKHATLAIPDWSTGGPWGTSAIFDPTNGKHITIPETVIDFTLPFSVIMLQEYTSVPGAVVYYNGFSYRKSTDLIEQLHISPQNYAYTIGFYNGTAWTYKTIEAQGSRLSGVRWCMFYVDPAGGKVTSLDPLGGYGDEADFGESLAFAPTNVWLSGFTTSDRIGKLYYAGVFQRKLELYECYAFMNHLSNPLLPINAFSSQSKTKSGAAASVADGGTISHGLATTPTWVLANATTALDFVSIPTKTATNFTVAIKHNDGTSGATQTIYWQAGV